MSATAIWAPIHFSPDFERAYRVQMADRMLPLLKVGNLVAAGFFLAFWVWDRLFEDGDWIATAWIRVAIAGLFVVLFASNFTPLGRSPRFAPPITVVGFTACGVGFTLVAAQLPGAFVAGAAGLMLPLILIPALVYSTGQAVLYAAPMIVFPLAGMAVFGAGWFAIANAAAWLGGAAVLAVAFGFLVDHVNRRAFQLEQELEAEKQRSDTLLLNILPAAVAERLKAHEEPIADDCPSATVMFADLVGFTELAREMPADRVVALLNDLFSRFDRLAARHGAEKIKTIGDAYMVAAGLPGSAADHVATIARLALDMREAFGDFRREHGLDLKLRIGVHSGAVVAGVIGERKFAYDLWGDTVNLASRMESSGLPDEIQISAETRALLPDGFSADPRGEIAIRGHLKQETYLLKARGEAKP